MSYEIRADYKQTHLFPRSLEEWVGADDPVRFIREFVDSLDLKELGFKERESTEGRPSYAADLLLKVWLYGYLERIRSSRKLEKACRQHMGLMWLTGMHYPDHNSLWRFWRDNRKAVEGVFRQTVQVAVRSEMVGMTLHALDGTKITSKGSTHQALGRKRLQQKLQRLDELIAEAMQEVEQAEVDEAADPEYRLPEELRDRKALREEIQKHLADMEKDKQEYRNVNEPEAQMMKNQEGKRLAYNAQAVVDSQAGIIVAPDVCTEANDRCQMVGMLQQVEDRYGRVAEETVSDEGYFSAEQLAAAEKAGYPVLVNLDSISREEGTKGRFHSWQFVYDSAKDCCICPRGKQLAYESTHRSRTGTYALRRYRCKEFRDCPERWACSQDKRGRAVKINPYLGAIHRQRQKQRDAIKAALMKRRMAIVEPVFARIKHLLEFRRWTMGGLAKVRAQWFFVCALANLSRMYPVWKEGSLKLA